MSESTVTTKGQTTIPQKIRESLGAGPGTRILWHLRPDGSITVRAKSPIGLHRGQARIKGDLLAPPGAKWEALD